MRAYVYKSLKKADTYVYFAARDEFARLPASLQAQLAPLKFVLELELTTERRLARADADEVRAHLVERGFYLQLPPATTLDPMTEDWGTDA